MVWKAQGLQQSNDAAYPKHQEERKPLKNKLHRVTSNRNSMMQMFDLCSLLWPRFMHFHHQSEVASIGD